MTILFINKYYTRDANRYLFVSKKLILLRYISTKVSGTILNTVPVK